MIQIHLRDSPYRHDPARATDRLVQVMVDVIDGDLIEENLEVKLTSVVKISANTYNGKVSDNVYSRKDRVVLISRNADLQFEPRHILGYQLPFHQSLSSLTSLEALSQEAIRRFTGGTVTASSATSSSIQWTTEVRIPSSIGRRPPPRPQREVQPEPMRVEDFTFEIEDQPHSEASRSIRDRIIREMMEARRRAREQP